MEDKTGKENGIKLFYDNSDILDSKTILKTASITNFVNLRSVFFVKSND